MSCTSISANAGVKLYIAPQAQLPADMAKASWEAVTGWVEVSKASSLGQRGPSRPVIAFKALDGEVCKQAGTTDYGTFTFEAADIPEDAGQQLLTTAVASQLSFPFKVTHNDATATLDVPSVEYFPAVVLTWAEAAASDSDSIRLRTGELALNQYLFVARASS